MQSETLNQTIDALNFERIHPSDFVKCCPYSIEDLRVSNREQDVTVWRNIGIFYYSVYFRTLKKGSNYLNLDHSLGHHALKVLLNVNKTQVKQMAVIEELRNYIANNELDTSVIFDVNKSDYVDRVCKYRFKKNVLIGLSKDFRNGIEATYDYINKVNV